LRRVDVTADQMLPDEGRVMVALHRLAQLPVRGRYPVRGEALSVSWPRKKGGFTRKAYSKYIESGDPGVMGLLRLEVGCIGQAAVRKAAGVDRRLQVRGRDLVGPVGEHLREKVGGAMVTMVEGYLKEVSEMEVWTAFTRFRAAHRSDVAMRFLGYCRMAQDLGGAAGLTGLLSRQAVWKFRKACQEAGVDPMEVEFGQGEGAVYLQELARSDPEAWARRIAAMMAEHEGDEDEEGAS